MRRALDALKAERAARIWPEIADPTPAERAAMPHEIDCEGVTADDLGEAFADELHRRKRWCRENCDGNLHRRADPASARLDPTTGRRFCFSDQIEMRRMFRLSFC